MPTIHLTQAQAGNNDFQLVADTGSLDKLIVLKRGKKQAALAWHWQQPNTKDAFTLFTNSIAEPRLDR